ncbi:MAG: tetratricopeptide repeat protein [Thermodesulfobacteriota bacterium]|nr:tetratricopeptide repeat protein [Thermodesulfobacteriota bacterium]
MTLLVILLPAVLFCHLAVAVEDPDALYKQGRFGEAEKAYAEADMDHPKDIRYRFNRGCAAFQKGDFQGATAAFSSVLRRAEDDEIRFSTAYNLGNAAFKQGDVQRAADLYRQAILYNPENEDAKYNLELALRELEKLKAEQDQGEQSQPQGEQGQGEDQQDQAGQEGQDPDKSSQQKDPQEQPSQESTQGQDQTEEKGQKGAQEEASSHEPQGAKQDQAKDGGGESPQDLSGELKAMDALPQEQEDETAPGAAMSMVDKRKAEALLDNVEENRAKFLQFQVPKEKRHGVSSGRDW